MTFSTNADLKKLFVICKLDWKQIYSLSLAYTGTKPQMGFLQMIKLTTVIMVSKMSLLTTWWQTQFILSYYLIIIDMY